MALTEWVMQGYEIANCNCEWGCPCQFNRPPSHGDCRAWMAVQVDKGRFGDVSLDGLRWGAMASWPGAIHQGDGTMQAIVDQRATPQQRTAIEAITQGRDTEPGKLVWQVFAMMTSTFLPTVTTSIDMSADFDQRTGSVRMANLLDGTIAPITNPVTGQPHRVRVSLPNGFEHTEAEFASGTAKSTGDIALDFTATHAHLTRVHWSTHGVIR